jgi:hypothetical protein
MGTFFDANIFLPISAALPILPRWGAESKVEQTLYKTKGALYLFIFLNMGRSVESISSVGKDLAIPAMPTA